MKNEDDMASALTTYSGSVHYVTGGYSPTVSDPVSGAIITGGMITAAVIEQIMGRL